MRLKDEYKDPNVLPKVNKADIVGTIEVIEEYLRLCCGVVRVPLAYVIRKTIIIVQNYGDYPKYATPDDKIMARMLNLSPDNYRLNNEQRA